MTKLSYLKYSHKNIEILRQGGRIDNILYLMGDIQGKNKRCDDEILHDSIVYIGTSVKNYTGGTNEYLTYVETVGKYCLLRYNERYRKFNDREVLDRYKAILLSNHTITDDISMVHDSLSEIVHGASVEGHITELEYEILMHLISHDKMEGSFINRISKLWSVGKSTIYERKATALKKIEKYINVII